MTLHDDINLPVCEYIAAGGVVIFKNKVLVLERSGRKEIRLPKGHVEDGEKLADAAVREVSEESGYLNLSIVQGLGVQKNEFDYDGTHIIRKEYYFLLKLEDESKISGEEEFIPNWLPLEDAIKQLTFEVEKEWVRRAMSILDKDGY